MDRTIILGNLNEDLNSQNIKNIFVLVGTHDIYESHQRLYNTIKDYAFNKLNKKNII